MLAGKANAVLGKVWGIGERLFKDQWKERMYLFDAITKGIILYGAECWGWWQHKRIETIQWKYIRWTLKLKPTTPEHTLSLETSRNNIWADAAKRAIHFETKIRNQMDGSISKECWRENERKTSYGKENIFKKEKEKLFNHVGWSTNFVQSEEENGIDICEETIRKVKKAGCVECVA